MTTQDTGTALSTWALEYLQQLTTARYHVSAHTVASYRAALRLLIDFLAFHHGRPVEALRIADVDASSVLAFLYHLEHIRGNCARSCNFRLATVRSFAHYVAMRQPEMLCRLTPVLELAARPIVRRRSALLSISEVEAMLLAPDPESRDGRRDRALLTLLYHTAARVSEISAVRCMDLHWHPTARLSIHGHGDRSRTVNLPACAAMVLWKWLQEIGGRPDDPLFSNQSGNPVTAGYIEHRVRLAAHRAAHRCPSLQGKTVSPNLIRRSAATHLLDAGMDLKRIGLRLGHTRTDTTEDYILGRARGSTVTLC